MINENKNKKIISLLISLCLVLSVSLVGVVFADDGVDQKELANLENEAEAAVNDVLVAEPLPKTNAFDLSLDAAIKHMDESVQMQMIKIQNMSDRAVAAGSTEGLKAIEKAKDSLKAARAYAQENPDSVEAQTAYAYADSAYSAASGSKKQLEIMKAYAKSQLTPNDTARKDALKLSSKEMYYNLKNLEKQVSIAVDNYEITKSTYEKTKLKYDLGTVSKMDLLNAESDLNKAKDTKLSAEDGLAQLKMGFNMFFGYDLMQEVNLTSDIEEVALSSISLEDGIKSALSMRNEIKEAKYALDIAKLNYATYRAYTSKSSKHLAAEAQYLAAKANNDTINDTIEMDVRSKYMAMEEAYEALKTAKLSESNAIESAKLAELQYDAGYCTLTVIQQAQLGSYQAQIAKAQALLDLALAVDEYEYSTGYGVKAASLQ